MHGMSRLIARAAVPAAGAAGAQAADGDGAGQVLCVRATDAMAAVDLPHFCAEAGHELLGAHRRGRCQRLSDPARIARGGRSQRPPVLALRLSAPETTSRACRLGVIVFRRRADASSGRPARPRLSTGASAADRPAPLPARRAASTGAAGAGSAAATGAAAGSALRPRPRRGSGLAGWPAAGRLRLASAGSAPRPSAERRPPLRQPQLRQPSAWLGCACGLRVACCFGFAAASAGPALLGSVTDGGVSRRLQPVFSRRRRLRRRHRRRHPRPPSSPPLPRLGRRHRRRRRRRRRFLPVAIAVAVGLRPRPAASRPRPRLRPLRPRRSRRRYPRPLPRPTGAPISPALPEITEHRGSGTTRVAVLNFSIEIIGADQHADRPRSAPTCHSAPRSARYVRASG